MFRSLRRREEKHDAVLSEPADPLCLKSHTLKIEVHRIRIGRQFGAPRFGGDKLRVERARQARDDFVLHVKEIGERLVEPLGPEVTASLRVNELHVDAHAVSAALDAALEDIADVQLAPDLLQIDSLALVGACGEREAWGIVRPLRLRSATCSSPQRDARGAFGLK